MRATPGTHMFSGIVESDAVDSFARNEHCGLPLAPTCLAGSWSRTPLTALRGTSSAGYPWHTPVWRDRGVGRRRQHCEERALRTTPGTHLFGGIVESEAVDSIARNEHCGLPLAPTCLAGSWSRTPSTALRGTSIADYPWHTPVWRDRGVGRRRQHCEERALRTTPGTHLFRANSCGGCCWCGGCKWL